HVLRRRRRVPGRGRPAPGGPRDVHLGWRRALVAGGARRRHGRTRARGELPRALARGGHSAARRTGRHAPRPLGRTFSGFTGSPLTWLFAKCANCHDVTPITMGKT